MTTSAERERWRREFVEVMSAGFWDGTFKLKPSAAAALVGERYNVGSEAVLLAFAPAGTRPPATREDVMPLVLAAVRELAIA